MSENSLNKLIRECHELEKWFTEYLETEKAKKKEQNDAKREKYRNIPKSVDADQRRAMESAGKG